MSEEFTLVIGKTGKEYTIPEDKSILQVLRAEGYPVESSCEQGMCGTCEVRVVSGIPDHRDVILSDDQREENKVMFICCSRAQTDRLVIDLY